MFGALHARRILALLCVAALLLAFAATNHPDTLWALPATHPDQFELVDLVRAVPPPDQELPPQPIPEGSLSTRAPPLA